ncbi:MAG: hypothetical protein CMK89_02035, partial [Pseudomonadales bacterium]|nr:hypothetical protein [Pseudomonadales bacterium]
ALVEQASAAGEAMAEQARSLMNLVGFFKLDHGASAVSMSHQSHAAPVVSNRAPASPAAKPGRAKAPAMGGGVRTPAAPSFQEDDEWEEF